MPIEAKSSLRPSPRDPHALELIARVILPKEPSTHDFRIRVEFIGDKSADQAAYQAAKHWLMIVHDWTDVLPGPGLYGDGE